MLTNGQQQKRATDLSQKARVCAISGIGSVVAVPAVFVSDTGLFALPLSSSLPRGAVRVIRRTAQLQ